jgi:hypothetical protein
MAGFLQVPLKSSFKKLLLGTGLWQHAKMIELHLDLVFWFGIGRYLPSILPTDTKGKLSWDVLVSYIWREPLFPSKGGFCPLFDGPSPPFERKISLRQIYKRSSRKISQNGAPAKSYSTKIPNQIYRPASASNLLIPTKPPVNRWDAMLQNEYLPQVSRRVEGR